jgi:glycosyltransferase involved in cell wall biosynthesis
LERIMADAPLRARLSAAALTTATRYAWPTVVASYVDLYRELVASRAAR